MTWWHALLLGALQGITEFLPISSSGHLVLVQSWLGVPDAEQPKGAALFFDAVLHLGTMVAVLIWFRRGSRIDLGEAAWPATRREVLRLGLLLALATLPACLAVLIASEHVKLSFERPVPVAWNFLLLGMLLTLTDLLRTGSMTGPQMRLWQALVLGCCQALSAIFRGLSRSGMTVAGGLACGLQRDWAVRFSFLMSVVASLGLGGFGIVQALAEPAATEWLTWKFVLLTVLGAATSGVVGYLTIDPLLRLVKRARLWYFAVYLWIVAAIVLLQEL